MPDRLWTRNYALTLGVSFLLSLVFYQLMTTMALYATQEFGAGDVLAGLTSSIFVIGAVIARLGAGIAVDRLGRRRVLVVSLVAFVVTALAYFPADGLPALLAVRLLHGIAFGAAHTAAGSIVQESIPPSRRGEGTGYHGASTTLGTAIGPFIAVLLMNNQGYGSVFVASTVAAFLALGAAIALSAPKDVPVAARAIGRPGRSLPIEVAALPIASFVFLGAIAFSGIIAFMNSFATSLELTSAAAVFFLVYAAFVIALRPAVGRLQDARGDNIIMYPAIAFFAVGLAVLAAANSGAVLLLAAVLIGVGWGTLLSAGQAVAVTTAPITHVGKTFATYFLLLDIGMGFGPVVLGVLVGVLDYRWMYLSLAVLVALSALLYHVVHGKKRRGTRRRADG